MKWRHGTSIGVLAVIAFATVFAPFVSATPAISQGYNAREDLPRGTLVSVEEDSTEVGKARLDTSKQLVGIVGRDTLVELSNSAGQVQVISSGVADVMVSDINGGIEVGDKITVSPIAGVGMKAESSGYIVGTAQMTFKDAVDIKEVEITTKSGTKENVKIGLVRVQIGVGYYEHIDANKSILPTFIIEIAKLVSGRNEVSPIRVFVALIVLIVGVLVVAVLVYSSVGSSIISIGRNPLAAGAVHKSLLEVILLAIGVLLFVLVGVYLVLIL
ncbi:MAG: hypothetical protein ACSLEY_00920 [Candidatus Saccharimonadales bacterium]